jgi:hypothetical protein
MMSFIFQNVFILFCNCLFYFSYIVVFTQQHKDNITNSDNTIENILEDKDHCYEHVTARIT